MSDYDLGTARGTIRLDYNGGNAGDRARSDMDSIAGAGSRTQASLDKAAKGMLIAGAGIVGGLGLAVKSAADFEKGLSGIKAVSGATTSEMDAVRKKALQLGADTQFSAGEAANAIEELVKAGISIPDVMNGAADATVALAAAGGIDLPAAATIAANSMNQFGLTAKQMPAIVDQIAGAANASAIDVADFGNSLTQVGAVANLAGLSFKDTAIAIAEMGNAGIKGSDAGTSLKTMLQNLIPTTKAQINESIKLGLITAGNATAMDKLRQRGIKPLSNSYADVQAAMMKYVVQQTGLKAGSEDARKAVSELGISTGAIQNQFFDTTGKVKKLSDIQAVLQKAYKGSTREQMLASQGMLFGTDAIRASAILTKAGAAGYTKMSTAMSKMSAADVAKTRMNNLSGSIEQLKGSAETMAIGLGSILLPMLKSLTDKLTVLVNWFVNLSPGMQKALVIALLLGGGLLLLAGGLIKAIQFVTAFKAAVILLKAQMLLLNLSFLANPIFLVIAAIIALIAIFVALYKNNAAFRAFIDKMWKGIQVVIGAVVGWITGTAVPWIVNAWNTIVAGAKILWAAMVSVWNSISNVISTVFQFIVLFVTTYINLVKTVITTAINFILGVWRAVWGLFGPLITGVFNLIVAIIQLAMRIVKLVITTAWNFIYGVVSAVVNRIRSIITTVFGAVNGFILRVFNSIKAFITTIWNAIYGAVSGPVGRVLSIVSSVFNAVKGVVSTVFNAIKGIATTAWNLVVTAISTALGKAISTVSGAVDKIKGFFSGVGTWLLDAGKKLIQGLIDGIRSMIKKVTDAMSAVTDKIKGFLPGSPIKEGPLVEWNGGTPGRKLVKMLAAGIAANVGMLDGAFAGVDLGLPTVLTGPTIAVAGSASRTSASGVNSGASGADRPSVYAPVTVHAPQTMSPEQVGRATATRLGYALSGHTTPIPVPAGAR